VQSASERTEDPTVKEQLSSIEQGLAQLSGDAELEDDQEEGERLQEIERQLTQLGDHTDGTIREKLKLARTEIDEFRQEHAQDWR
jgi:molecular chaperone GrpE (heat shock protein)